MTIYFVDKYQDASFRSKLSCYITPGTAVARSEITSWVPGSWYHLAVTLGDSGMRLYVNGVLSTYVESNSIYQCFDDVGVPTKFYFSKSHGNITPPQEDNCIRGKMDEIRIYNKAKTAAEILADYNAQK